jgi:hypothetical protein
MAAQGFSVPAKRDRNATPLSAKAGNPRRMQNRAKKAIYGWKLIKFMIKNLTVSTL